MSKLKARDLGENDRKAVCKTTAKTMGVSENSVRYRGSEVLDQNDDDDSRRLLSIVVEGESVDILTTYTLKAITEIALPLTTTVSGTSFSNATSLFASLSSKLEAAVSDGSFSSLLQEVSVEVGATVTVGADVTEVISSNPIVNIDDSIVINAAKEMNTRQIVVISIAAFVGLWISLSWLYLKILDLEDSMRFNPKYAKGTELKL